MSFKLSGHQRTLILPIFLLSIILSACSGGSKTSTYKVAEEPKQKKPATVAAGSEAEVGLVAVPTDASPTDSTKTKAEDMADPLPEPGDSRYRVVEPSENADVDEMPYQDNAKAVDDDIWREFDAAEDYHGMGVIANREASWEEAQYYFERSLKILANLDIESDSAETPEAVKYSTLLDNVIADYRVALRSLGRLEEDVAPSVLLERFQDLEARLGSDTLRTYGVEAPQVMYDLPVVMNDRVKKSIVYFQTVARDAFIKFLSRSKRYEMLYREVLTQYGLPHDLIYLSMVESGFSPHAYSWARAMGLWQFIASTGRLYGLKRDWWLDERKDPIKSTHAAARFLKDLYEQFGDWELAMAAYNGGPGRVSRTVARQRTDDFWKLSTLPKQTKDYVPLIFAATIISKNPAKYGFSEIEYEAPIEWEEVTINKSLEFKTIAESINCPVEKLKDLNPELLRGMTPPNFPNYKLKIPTGKRHAFLASYDNMAASATGTLVKHTIRRGESLASIASQYGVSRYALAEANGLGKKAKLIAGNDLIVPVPTDRSYSAAEDNTRTKYKTSNSIYTVRSGDTMWDIAKAFNTSIDAVRRLNYLDAGARIYVGQKLKIPGKSKRADTPILASKDTPARNATLKSTSRPSASDSYTVRPGDTVWEIAKKYNMTTTRLREINGLDRASTIRAGQVLKVASNAAADFVIHKVRSGDTISRIAATYRTTIAKILENNNLQNADDLKVGARLKIYKR